LVSVGRGTEVSVGEPTGGGAVPELEGGNPVTVELGGTVLEVRFVEVGEIVLLVVVNVGVGVDGGGDWAGMVELDAGGGRALGSLPLPLSGVILHVSSCLTMSVPLTVIGVSVIVHVWMNVPAPVVIL